MEDPKNIKDDKKQKESPELKEELTEDELKGVPGGVGVENTGYDSAGGNGRGQKNLHIGAYGAYNSPQNH
jgi:hypothetical protein